MAIASGFDGNDDDPLIGKELARTTADYPLRKSLKAAGVNFVVESGIVEWTGQGARILSLLDGSEQMIAADSLVLATTNRAEDWLTRELSGCELSGSELSVDEDSPDIHSIGDCVAPRQAPYAFYEGRKLGMTL